MVYSRLEFWFPSHENIQRHEILHPDGIRSSLTKVRNRKGTESGLGLDRVSICLESSKWVGEPDYLGLTLNKYNFLALEILLKNTPCPELITILSITFVCTCVNVFSTELSLVLAQYHTCAHELPLVKENSDF